MHSLRSFFRAHAWLAALTVALALALKAVVPGGYMVSAADGLAIVPCPTAFTLPAPPAAGHDHHAMADHGAMAHQPAPAPAEHDKHAAAQQACPYAVLSLATLAGADAIQLAALLAFVLALALAPRVPPSVRPIPYLRPPLRAPPVSI